MGQPGSDPPPTDSPCVAIVLVRDFAAGLERLAGQMPVWVINTPTNRATVETLRAGASDLDITLFTATSEVPAEEICADLFGVVELHHGPDSGDPPCAVIEVIGAAASPAVREALAATGYELVSETADGFLAARAVEEVG